MHLLLPGGTRERGPCGCGDGGVPNDLIAMSEEAMKRGELSTEGGKGKNFCFTFTDLTWIDLTPKHIRGGIGYIIAYLHQRTSC
jgi:hypothetical protein